MTRKLCEWISAKALGNGEQPKKNVNRVTDSREDAKDIQLSQRVSQIPKMSYVFYLNLTVQWPCPILQSPKVQIEEMGMADLSYFLISQLIIGGC